MKKSLRAFAITLLRRQHVAAQDAPTSHTTPQDAPAFVQSGDYKDINKMVAAVYALPSTPYIPIHYDKFNPTEGAEIGMACAGITDAASHRPILGTFGITTCMGIAIYNPQNKIGGLAHLSQSPDDCISLCTDSRESLQKLLKAVRTAPEQPLEVRIMGPMNNAKRFLTDVLSELNDTPNLRILSADYNDKPYVTAFGMDTRRWSEGLLKGSNSSGLDMRYPVSEEEALRRTIEGQKYRVAISDLPQAARCINGLYDERSTAPTPTPKPTATTQPR